MTENELFVDSKINPVFSSPMEIQSTFVDQPGYNVIIGAQSDAVGASKRTVIIGPNNIVRGSFNTVVGSNNHVEGDNNVIFGSNLNIVGDNHKIVQDTELNSYKEGNDVRSYTLYRLISALEKLA